MCPIFNVIGSAAVAAILLSAASGTASAQTINYASQTAQDVTVNYNSLPAGTLLQFVNQTTGANIPSLIVGLIGSGSVAVPFVTLPSGPGQYYVLAQWNGQYVSQTVMFYVHKP